MSATTSIERSGSTDHRRAAVHRPLPTQGGTVQNLLHFLRTQTILEDKELAAFAADVEEGRKLANQPPVSPWDS